MRTSTARKWKRRAWVWLVCGAAALGVAGDSYRTAADIHRHNYEPLRLPIRFDRASATAASFTPDFDGTVAVRLDLQQSLPYERLQALLGNPFNQDDVRAIRGPKLPEVTWSVTNPPGVVLDRENRGAYFGGTVGLTIGHFPVRRGRSYTIAATTKHPAAELQVLDPHLVVELCTQDYDERYWNATVSELVAPAAALAALAGFVAAAWCWVLARRSFGGRLADHPASAAPPRP